MRGFEEIGRTYLPDGNAFTHVDFELLNTVPVVSAVLGAAAGLPAVHAVLAHFNVMAERNAHVFPGGPPVVKAAPGATITKEELGGPAHPRAPERHRRQPRRRRGATPSTRSAGSSPTCRRRSTSCRRVRADDDPLDRRDESLLDVVAAQPPPHVRPAVASSSAVVDDGSFFEIAPNYGRARITGLARVDGFPVGVMANDPLRAAAAPPTSPPAPRRPADPAVRHVPPAARRLRRRAGVDGRPRVRAAGHRAGRRAPGRARSSPAGCRSSCSSSAGSTASAASPTTGRRACSAATRGRRPAGARCTSPAAPSAAYRREIEAADDPAASMRRDRGPPAAPRLAVPHGRGDGPGHHRPARQPAAGGRVRARRPARARPPARPARVPYRP